METKTTGRRIVSKGEYMKAQMKRIALFTGSCTTAIFALIWAAVTSGYFWIDLYHLAFGANDQIYPALLFVVKVVGEVGVLFVLLAATNRLGKQACAMELLSHL